MRKILLIVVLFPLFAKSQRSEHITAFEKSIPAGLGKQLRLPEPGYNPDFNMDDIADYFVKQRIRVIAADSVYRKIFWQYRFTIDSVQQYAPEHDSWYHQWLIKHLQDSIPAIDFNTQELVMYSACGQCLAYCHHDEYESCHRNACDFMYAWFLRDKRIDIKKETGAKRNFLDALYGYNPGPGFISVDMPFAEKTGFSKYFEVGKKSSYFYQVHDSGYNKVFDWYLQNKIRQMPEINFKEEELWVRIVCHQCLSYCISLGKEWDNSPCHRHACRYSYSWFVKKKSAWD